uniref:Uncharacterized protein n=1 Tax=Arundo donax TaxID=35708 RepID=A0A0A9APA5_ARUDO
MLWCFTFSISLLVAGFSALPMMSCKIDCLHCLTNPMRKCAMSEDKATPFSTFLL